MSKRGWVWSLTRGLHAGYVGEGESMPWYQRLRELTDPRVPLLLVFPLIALGFLLPAPAGGIVFVGGTVGCLFAAVLLDLMRPAGRR